VFQGAERREGEKLRKVAEGRMDRKEAGKRKGGGGMGGRDHVSIAVVHFSILGVSVFKAADT